MGVSMKKLFVFFFAIFFVLGMPLLSRGALYKPGQLRTEKGLRSPLTPPSQEGVNPNHFKVAADILLHYFLSGEGKPVLVIHGGPGFPPTKPWDGLESLTGDYQFFYYHQRGCGHSTRPIDTFDSQNFMQNVTILEKVLGLSAQLADIERIRRILGFEKLILIGHSYGGFLAALYAVEFPEHVEKMVLIAPAGVLKMPIEEGEGFEKIKDYLSEKQKEEFDDFLSRYFDYGKIFTKSEKDLSILNAEYIQHFGAAMESRGLELPGMTKENLALSGGWMVHALYLSLGMTYDLREELKKIPVPVLVLHGEKDMMPIEASQEYADLLPEGKIYMIPESTHFPFSENPVQFARIVTDFFTKN
jgi:proline iminopeptidase